MIVDLVYYSCVLYFYFAACGYKKIETEHLWID